MDSWRELVDADLTCEHCKTKFKGLSQVRSHMKWSEHNRNEAGEYLSPLLEKLGWKAYRTYAVRYSYVICTLCRSSVQCGSHLQVRTTCVKYT